MNVLIVIGTRPGAIKMAPAIRERSTRSGVSCRRCATGQHQESARRGIVSRLALTTGI